MHTGSVEAYGRVVGRQRTAAAQLVPGAARAPRAARAHHAHAERELVAQAVVAATLHTQLYLWTN